MAAIQAIQRATMLNAANQLNQQRYPQANILRANQQQVILPLHISQEQLQKAKRMILRGLETVLLLFVTFALSLVFFITHSMPFSVVMAPLVLLYVRKTQLQFLKVRHIYKQRPAIIATEQATYMIRYITKYKQLLESVITLVFWAALLITIQVKGSLSLTIAILAIAILQRFAWFKYLKHETNSYVKKGVLVWKILLMMQLLNIFLKFDGYVNWKWEIVIWPIYIICSIALICSVSSLLICVGQLCNYIVSSEKTSIRPNHTQESRLCIGFWVFYVINGFSCALIYSVLLLIQNVHSTLQDTTTDSNQTKNSSQAASNYQIALYPTIYFAGVIVLTALNLRNLQIWIIKNILIKQASQEQTQSVSEMDVSQIEQSFEDHDRSMQAFQQRTTQFESSKQKEFVMENDSLEGTPRFLMHVSGSYFQTVKTHSKALLSKLTQFGLYKQNSSEDGFAFESNPQKKGKTSKTGKKKTLEPASRISSNQLRVGSFVIDDKVCFTDMNEDVNIHKQTYKEEMLRSKGIQGDLQTVDQLFMDNAVASKYNLDKKLFINEMKSEPEDERMKQNLKQQLANNSLLQVQKVLLEGDGDTYQEFKRDPAKFSSQFQGRLSERKVEKVQDSTIKNKIMYARKLMKARLADGSFDPSQIDAIQKECLICLENRSDAVIMNCGHGGICFECSTRLTVKRTDQKCHLCRKPIKRIFKIDLPKVSGSFIPVTQYLDLRGPVPELKVISKPKMIDLESIDFAINEEFLSEDGEIQVHSLTIHDQEQLFIHQNDDEPLPNTTRDQPVGFDIQRFRTRRFSFELDSSSPKP